MTRVRCSAGFWAVVAAALTGVVSSSCRRSEPELAVPQERPITDLVRSEEIADAVGRAIKGTLIKGLRDRDRALIRSGLADDFRGLIPEPQDGWTRQGQVSVWRMPERGGSGLLAADPFAARLEKLLADFASVERASWRAFRSIAEERGGVEQRVDQAVHFAMAGVRRDGRRVQVHGTAQAEIVLAKDKWRLRRLEFDAASWIESALPPFADLARISGLDFNPSEQNRKIVQTLIDDRALLTSGGLTALDFDRNGFPDLLATYWDRETVLFMNDGVGGFRPTRLPLIDRPEKVSKFYLWLDLDDDGREELVGTQVLQYGPHGASLGLYTWRKGRMTRVDGALTFEIPPWMRRISFEGITACDVNHDDRIDLVFIGYDHQDSVQRARLIDNAKDGMRNLLFINQGGLRFAEEGMQRGLTASQYSFVADCHDFDSDGDPDLFVGNDYGRNNYFENLGDGRFREDTDHPFHTGASFSMGVSLADFDNSGRFALSVSNMYSHAGNRIIPLAEGLTPQRKRSLLLLASGNSLYETEGGRWKDNGLARGLDEAGWAWGNMFFDFDNDGDKDLYVVNGYTTNSDEEKPDY